jgi:excisionase family DNA binding protein
MSKTRDKPISDYLTVGEASKLLGVSGTTLRNWDRQGKLKPRRNPMNKYRLYSRSEILLILKRIKKGEE